MRKIIFISSCLLVISILSIFLFRNRDDQFNPSIDNITRDIHDKGKDYERIASTLSIDIDELINALEESKSEPPLDLNAVAAKLNVTERELSDAMGPPPFRPNEQDSRPQPQNSGMIFPSLTTDFGNSDFEINSSAIENGELLDAYQCEKKCNKRENSIPLSWNNIPESTKSLAIVMYHYPDPHNMTARNSYLLLWGIDPTVKEILYGEADNGEWYMGQNKDGDAISYTSPCSRGPGTHEYIISIFALSEYPELLPEENSLSINFDIFMTAIENVQIVGRADLSFKVITE